MDDLEGFFGTCTTSNETISGEDILKQISEAHKTLNEHSQKAELAAQEAFKTCFGADYGRGDIIVFPLHRKASYNLVIDAVPVQLRNRFRLDPTGKLKHPVVLNGDYVPKPIKEVVWRPYII